MGIRFINSGSVYEISENDIELILNTAAEAAEIDLKTCSQRQWKFCLQQIGKYINRTKSSFKGPVGRGRVNIKYTPDQLMGLVSVYIELSNKYDKLISIDGFSYMSNIPVTTINSWKNIEKIDNSVICDADDLIPIQDTIESDDNDIYTYSQKTYNRIISDNIDNYDVNNRCLDDNDMNSYYRDNNSHNDYNSYNNSNEYNNYNSYDSNYNNYNNNLMLYNIFIVLKRGMRDCILDKAFDSKTAVSAPFMFNVEFSEDRAENRRTRIDDGRLNRRTIAEKYGFDIIPADHAPGDDA